MKNNRNNSLVEIEDKDLIKNLLPMFAAAEFCFFGLTVVVGWGGFTGRWYGDNI